MLERTPPVLDAGVVEWSTFYFDDHEVLFRGHTVQVKVWPDGELDSTI